MKIFNLLLFILLVQSNALHGQVDTVLVKDFSNDWVFIDDNKQLPLVKKSDFSGNIIQFEIDKRDYADALLKIASPNEVSIFVNGSLREVFSGQVFINLNEFKSTNDLIQIGIYANDINPYLLTTKAFKIVEANKERISDGIVIKNPRQSRAFTNFFVVATVVIFLFFAVLINLYPRTMAEYFKISRALSPRELDENLLKGRPLTGINMLFYALVSFVLSILVFSLIHLATIFPELNYFHPTAFWSFIFNWIQLAFIIFMGIILKLALIKYFTTLYAINSFVANHFFNFVRLNFLFAFTLFIIVVFSFIGFSFLQSQTYLNYFMIMLFSFLPISLVIYLKLLSSTPFKNLHLFSYLCATELIPFVIILSFGINKLF